MSNIKSLDELAVSLDVIARMATFAFAKAFNEEQADILFRAIELALKAQYGDKYKYDIVDDFRDAVSIFQKEFE